MQTPEKTSKVPRHGLAEFLPYQLSIAANAVSDRIAEAYQSRFGLKVTEWRVMAVLGDAGKLTQRELTALIRMDKVAINRACKQLESRALLTRAPNLRDGRSHHLVLTDEGRAMHSRIMPLARSIERRLFEPFDEAEQTALRNLLERMREQAEKIGPGADYDAGA
ncbi:winged helix-turn-helix transcriptional regulator [Altererythrobacter sp. SALINAS58]|uniref:MarR family winged helix-turn-helix transcriptional regulator n=1 Tax=Alteripontixanthobacter muriae TaxID=2705546 RepID=UPI00157730DF|nr:MarR family winged helix-turn-helix transcriptional regulator [Alteripontixanthobacter muriae]NTZ42249.1 winged helix-turn-helix transcriptional regulator [Alteripontixanthobacter muriae]